MDGAEPHVHDALADSVAFLCAEEDMRLGLDFVASQCVALLGVAAAGLMVAVTPGSGPVPVAAATEPLGVLQRLTHEYGEGPALDTFASGGRVDCPDLAEEATRWPRFGPAARALGFRALHTLPLRLHGQTVGVLTLADNRPGGLAETDLARAQALAAVAALGLGAYRTRQSEQLATQLQAALSTRVLIEQAKGLLAERLNTSVDEAFALLRAQARSSRRKLREVAESVLKSHTSNARRTH